MANFDADPVRAIAGQLARGVKGFRTVSMTDLVRIWRAHPATNGDPSEADCDAIEDCLKSFDSGRNGGYVVFPPLAECSDDESFRIYREHTAYGNVHRMLTQPNQLDDGYIVEIVERWKGKWHERPRHRPDTAAHGDDVAEIEDAATVRQTEIDGITLIVDQASRTAVLRIPADRKITIVTRAA
jgi:hypothetical protein